MVSTDFENIDEEVIDEVDWDLGAIQFHPNSTTYRVVETLLRVYDALHHDADDVHNATHLDTSSNGSLDNIGALANLERKTGESDEKYRERIRAKLAGGSTESTYQDTYEYVAAVFDIDGEDIEFSFLDGAPGTVFINIPNDALDNTSLSTSELSDIFDNVVAAGGDTSVQTFGSFVFDGPDYNPPSNSGFGEGTLGALLE